MDASQSLIVGVSGPSLGSEEAKLLRNLQPGGFILFGRNIKDPIELRKLIEDLYDLSKTPPIICIDQEGGRVARLREIGSEPASAKELTDYGTLAHIKRHGEMTGRLLKLFGFNLNLCPVLDISYNGDTDNSLKNRCYGYTPEEVIEKAGTFNRALKSTQILGCGKHFPGYSKAQIDPHHELPRIMRSESELESWEWKPFKALLHETDSQMIGHAFYPLIDQSGLPSSLSRYFIQEVLRDRWNYQGVIMTDDLDMGAIINTLSISQATEKAILAGNDMVLLCHRNHLAQEAVEGILRTPRAQQERALENILRFKSKIPKLGAFNLNEFNSLNIEMTELRAELIGEEKSKVKSIEDAKRSPVETFYFFFGEGKT